MVVPAQVGNRLMLFLPRVNEVKGKGVALPLIGLNPVMNDWAKLSNINYMYSKYTLQLFLPTCVSGIASGRVG